MGHARARLTVFGRQLLIARVEAGWPAAHVAEQLGISRATNVQVDPTVSKGRARRSARSDIAATPLTAPPGQCRGDADPGRPVDLAIRSRSARATLGRPPSTVHRVLVRRGVSRLRDADRVTMAPVRYVACHPGALVHQDHKKQGRIPDGGGWRVLGRDGTRDRHRPAVGYEHLEVVVDDASRLAVVVPVPDESGASAAHALEVAAVEFARLGITIERVLTDNG